ncbi:MAG: hypothetical protein GX638_06575, partial [Crenarchaeota archaeon]|nr:hypothetical protein [Thermoproteota archaeon]
NSYSGSTLSTHGGLCVGYATACGGIENGGSLYWDRGGSFMGATVYAGVYASLGMGMARVSAGYEAGLFGMEGRGLYAGANVGKDGASLYASWAENGGFDYGGQVYANLLTYDAYNHPSGYKKETLKKVYELQKECGNLCEVTFTKDGRIEIVMRKGKGEPFTTNLFGENEDDAHSHFAILSDNPDGPSNRDGYEANKRVLTKHYVLLPEKQELVRYTGPEEIQSEYDFYKDPSDAVIRERWSIYDNAGWKIDFRFGY